MHTAMSCHKIYRRHFHLWTNIIENKDVDHKIIQAKNINKLEKAQESQNTAPECPNL